MHGYRRLLVRKASLGSSWALFRTFSHKETVPGLGAVSRVLDSPSATVLLGLACDGARVGKGRSTGPHVCVPVREEATVCYPLQMAASV